MSLSKLRARLRGSTVLVTGASSGLGADFARRFASLGCDVVLVARRLDRLEELATEISSRHGVTATPVAADLAVPGAGSALKATLSHRGITVHSLVNNAGFGTHQPFVEEDPVTLGNEIAVNIGAVVDLSRAFLPDMIEHGAGVLITLASTAAYQPLPGMAVYAASKAFVLSFTEALAVETRGTGVTVMAVSPGPTETEFFEVLGSTDAAFGKMQTSEQVMDTTFAALAAKRPPASVVSGVNNKLQSAGVRLLPRRAALEVTARMFRK